ncbi:hypothetical protein GDO86_015046 [Hymenochirus boettgeri]|uniref:Inter-alpha-trypsin inhibitor heavy chain family member 6 n=1 Tax=Hymenochirus boettgeri TaxID=247094 RepID=A0A8T2JX47_9PIPI|nr:hypothetical protein GDO86_015046 [Hymenochirus boettgeri]
MTISRLHIQSTIVSRYALTEVHTLMVNPHPDAKEAIFDLELPAPAFISNFTLTVNGKTYVADVKEKHQAKKMYEEARKQGKTTAHVGTRDRETEKFRVSVNVEAKGEIAFALSYEELLGRQLGKYEHSVSVRPGQVVQNLSVEITISERTGIEYVLVLPLRTSRLMTNSVRGEANVPQSTQIEKTAHCARITFNPSPKEQTAYSRTGIAADFVINYDVTMKDLAGDVQIYNGYFVHYFAPRGLPTIQKNVVFVIDVSGSMLGTKIKQTKSAMHVILNDLHREDLFNIITFSDVVHVWRPGQSIQATAQNIKSAKEYVNKIEADGWTDINAAILSAASLFNQTSQPHKRTTTQKIPLIIFLTDGEATSGVIASSRILGNAQKALKGSISLFCLAFGEDADYNLMRRLSLENRGIARRIYEYSDATLQLKGFYDEIASPLLFDIELTYLGDSAQNVTQTLFPNYFEGSELVVTGKLKSGAKDLKVQLTAHDQKQKLSLENDISLDNNDTEPTFGCSRNVEQIQWFVQRLWAYFTIKDLLQARIKANDTLARRLLTEKATNLSLKYNFVTPVTSLIVVKPEDEDNMKTSHATTTVQSTTASRTPAFSATNTSGPSSTISLKTKITSSPRTLKTTSRSIKTSQTTTISTSRPPSPKTTAPFLTTESKGLASATFSPVTSNQAMVISTSSIPTTYPDFRNSFSSHSTVTLRPHPFTLVSTAKPRTEKSFPSIGTTIHHNVPTTETQSEVLPVSVHASTGSLSFMDHFWTSKAVTTPSPTTTTPSPPTTIPMDSTSLRFILAGLTELQHEIPTYVESLNPPTVYNFLKAIPGRQQF